MSEISTDVEELEALEELEYQFRIIEEAIITAEKNAAKLTTPLLIEWIQAQECPVDEPLAALFKI